MQLERSRFRPIEDVPADFRRMDHAFAAAMNDAIRRGCEHPHVGIKIDLTPFVGKFIVSPPIFSACSSPALLCAEQGASDTRGLTDSY